MRDSGFLKDIDVVILCGGKGRRLGAITKDIPKPMVMIGGRPFLDILIERISSFGFKRFVLCVGYKKEVAEEYFRAHKRSGVEVVFSREDERKLLGTGGGLKNAEGAIKSSTFLVMNGDSFLSMDFGRFLEFHGERKAVVSIALTKAAKRTDAGSVRLGAKDEIVEFSEKDNNGCTVYMNGGVYVFDSSVFRHMPVSAAFSLEYDLFPLLTGKGIYGYVTGGEVLDIGTTERLEMAKTFFSGVCKK